MNFLCENIQRFSAVQVFANGSFYVWQSSQYVSFFGTFYQWYEFESFVKQSNEVTDTMIWSWYVYVSQVVIFEFVQAFGSRFYWNYVNKGYVISAGSRKTIGTSVIFYILPFL